MYTAYYKEKKTFLRWSDGKIIGYLNEKVVKDYQPAANADGDTPEKYDAISYTGELTDGGTVMPCDDMTDYNQVANAIIRAKYSVSEELAIQRHAINGDYKEDATEYTTYNEWCEYAKSTAKSWLGITTN
jgi:hypothetical protein